MVIPVANLRRVRGGELGWTDCFIRSRHRGCVHGGLLSLCWPPLYCRSDHIARRFCFRSQLGGAPADADFAFDQRTSAHAGAFLQTPWTSMALGSIDVAVGEPSCGIRAGDRADHIIFAW